MQYLLLILLLLVGCDIFPGPDVFILTCDSEIEVQLWDECYNIEETTELDLSGSWTKLGELSGEIPPEIGGLVNLIYLNLSFNLLSTIPSEISSLVNLSHLDLRYNRIFVIPEDICNISSNLNYFNIEGNYICEQLPSCLTIEDTGSYQNCVKAAPSQIDFND